MFYIIKFNNLPLYVSENNTDLIFMFQINALDFEKCFNT